MKLAIALLVLLTGTPWAQAQSRVGELTARRDRIVERTQVLKLWSFEFGPSGVNNMNTDQPTYASYGLTLGHHWEVNENAEILANVHTNLPSRGRATFSSFGLGGSWLPSTRDISPVIGAEMGYAYAMIPDASDISGFSVGGHAGLRLFRTSAAQMGIKAYIKSILFAEGTKWPVDYGLGLSVLY